MSRIFFTGFWGLLALSAAQGIVQHAIEGRPWMVFGGLLALVWTGGNTYLWAKGKTR